MIKAIAVAVGGVLFCAAGTSWAGTFTASSIVEYVAPLEAEHKSEEEKRGLEIYKQQYLLDEGWKDLETYMDMLLIDATGHESHRKVVKRVLEDGNLPDKTIGIFVEPADVRGTVMLTFEQSYGSDEQWLYLPAIKRTKKINAENKSGSFLGTEFSWEDISTSELTKYHYKYVRDEGKTWVVERTPVSKFSGYSRELTWVNKDNYQTVKVEYYDKKGEILKTLELGSWKQYLGRYWRPQHFEMVNHQNHKKTILELSSYRFGTGVDKKEFSSLGLDRVGIPEIK